MGVAKDMSSDKKTPGQIVRIEREKRGLSQTQLARKIPMSQSALHKIEKDETLSSTKAIKIAKVLSIDPSLLVRNEEDEKTYTDTMKSINNLGWEKCEVWVADYKENHNEKSKVINFPFFKEKDKKEGLLLFINLPVGATKINTLSL